MYQPKPSLTIILCLSVCFRLWGRAAAAFGVRRAKVRQPWVARQGCNKYPAAMATGPDPCPAASRKAPSSYTGPGEEDLSPDAEAEGGLQEVVGFKTFFWGGGSSLRLVGPSPDSCAVLWPLVVPGLWHSVDTQGIKKQGLWIKMLSRTQCFVPK